MFNIYLGETKLLALEGTVLPHADFSAHCRRLASLPTAHDMLVAPFISCFQSPLGRQDPLAENWPHTRLHHWVNRAFADSQTSLLKRIFSNVWGHRGMLFGGCSTPNWLIKILLSTTSNTHLTWEVVENKNLCISLHLVQPHWIRLPG